MESRTNNYLSLILLVALLASIGAAMPTSEITSTNVATDYSIKTSPIMSRRARQYYPYGGYGGYGGYPGGYYPGGGLGFGQSQSSAAASASASSGSTGFGGFGYGK
ncbi:glycine-rich cell wall structural protein [Folsomia candida]|uniref:Uncharacterized protein n=1 Tax=Folsomia candida TaxID=158441 RepID=A0A226F359_FOLCA|nr:glycine-rich cell wall structural protein [Folsomia candida]OXA64225.1 hypothetical protein Fcan01_00429 [Folsomia candida]